MALQWVNKNIASFGGDVTRVTLFGESSGSTAVIYQSRYHGNRGLFQRAMAESGSLGSPWGFAYNTSAHATFKKLVGAVGCKGNKTQIMTCIRNVPSQKIQDL